MYVYSLEPVYLELGDGCDNVTTMVTPWFLGYKML